MILNCQKRTDVTFAVNGRDMHDFLRLSFEYINYFTTLLGMLTADHYFQNYFKSMKFLELLND